MSLYSVAIRLKRMVLYAVLVMSSRDLDNTPEWKRRRQKLPPEVEPLSFLNGPADKRATRIVADEVVGRRSSKKLQPISVSASSSDVVLPSVSDCNTETEISSRSQSQNTTEVLSYDLSQVSELPLSVASTCQGFIAFQSVLVPASVGFPPCKVPTITAPRGLGQFLWPRFRGRF